MNVLDKSKVTGEYENVTFINCTEFTGTAINCMFIGGPIRIYNSIIIHTNIHCAGSITYSEFYDSQTYNDIVHYHERSYIIHLSFTGKNNHCNVL